MLLNGKRVAGSPSMGGSSINLNSIPMAAVERVEVNLDGGSALYGSDAIGGVINVILKQDYEGLEFQGRIGSPTEEGGDEKSGSIVSGITGEKGALMMVYEHDVKDEIYYKDRDYLAREVLPHLPDAYIDETFCDDKDKAIGRVGYEINFNRFFYQYVPPRKLHDIDAELKQVESEIAALLAEVATE